MAPRACTLWASWLALPGRGALTRLPGEVVLVEIGVFVALCSFKQAEHIPYWFLELVSLPPKRAGLHLWLPPAAWNDLVKK